MSFQKVFDMSPMPLVAAGPNNDAANWLKRAAAIVAGNALLWASAKAQVPFWPVPMTMQTYVVLTMAVLLGWRLAGATMVAYLVEGAVGLPVFAGTPALGIGLAYMAGPTGGYLLGYLLAVVLAGILADRARWGGSTLGLAGAMLSGELVILGAGCCWLAVQVGWNRAFAVGVEPFLPGDGLKLVLAIGTLVYWRGLRSSER
jgi:biotin transport system substrate-specific component